MAQFGTERRQFVPIEKIPPLLQKAVVAVEDHRFYSHHGIDLLGLGRAVMSNLTGGMRQGASTITQQVARSFFLSHKFTPERKLKEALLALQIEHKLDKQRILELYLNQIFMGQRYYGFAAAADAYFSKTLDQLTVGEVALLAGLPQNPYYANPATNLPRALVRQRVVLARMQAAGVITDQQAEAARTETITVRPRVAPAVHAEYVAEMARRAVVERFGADAYLQGLQVHTSVDSTHQQAAWSAARRGVLAHDARRSWRGPEGQEDLPTKAKGADLDQAALQALKGYNDDDQLRLAIVLSASPREVLVLLATGERVRLTGDALRLLQPGLSGRAAADLAVRRGSVLRIWQPGDAGEWAAVQWPEVETALVAMDPVTGRVRALVGGFDHGHQPFNHVTQAWRQPGSAFKPFLYSAALEAGVMPGTLVNDAPLNLPNGWDPRNHDNRNDGPITLRQGLARSKNLVSVRVLQKVGVDRARSWTEKFGFDLERQPDNLALALGAGGTTPMQLAQGYAVLANGGWRVTPVVIERITDAQGKVLFTAPPPPAPTEANRAVPARNVFITNSLLNDVTRKGTAALAQRQLNRSDVYGKTGTTNDAVDAWFAGFQPGLVAVVWVGHDQPQSLGVRETGGGLALPIWIKYMQFALKDVREAKPPKPPAGLVKVDDWRYAEYADGGHVRSIGGGVRAAQPADEAASESTDSAEGGEQASAANTPAPALPAAPAVAPAPAPASVPTH